MPPDPLKDSESFESARSSHECDGAPRMSNERSYERDNGETKPVLMLS
jgi:hypothetical protein